MNIPYIALYNSPLISESSKSRRLATRRCRSSCGVDALASIAPALDTDAAATLRFTNGFLMDCRKAGGECLFLFAHTDEGDVSTTLLFSCSSSDSDLSKNSLCFPMVLFHSSMDKISMYGIDFRCRRARLLTLRSKRGTPSASSSSQSYSPPLLLLRPNLSPNLRVNHAPFFLRFSDFPASQVAPPPR